MKSLILAILLLLSVTTVAQESKIIRQYDRFEDRTRYWTPSAYMTFGLSFTATFSYRGQGEGNEVENFGLIFTSVSETWKYTDGTRLYCLIDGKSLNVGTVKAMNRDVVREADSVHHSKAYAPTDASD